MWCARVQQGETEATSCIRPENIDYCISFMDNVSKEHSISDSLSRIMMWLEFYLCTGASASVRLKIRREGTSNSRQNGGNVISRVQSFDVDLILALA